MPNLSITEYRKILRDGATEAEIQRAIVGFLKERRIPHSVTDATEAFNRNGQRVRRVGRGWPDITGCIPQGGIFIAIECKSNKGRLRPDQARTLHDLWQAGALVVVARSVEDVQDALKSGRIRDCDAAEICRYKDRVR